MRNKSVRKYKLIAAPQVDHHYVIILKNRPLGGFKHVLSIYCSILLKAQYSSPMGINYVHVWNH